MKRYIVRTYTYAHTIFFRISSFLTISGPYPTLDVEDIPKIQLLSIYNHVTIHDFITSEQHTRGPRVKNGTLKTMMRIIDDKDLNKTPTMCR
jgi:hypothetical protein